MTALTAARLAEIEALAEWAPNIDASYAAAIRDLLDELRRQEWQPIESAPQNELVLVFCPDAVEADQIMICHFFITEAPWDHGGWYEQNPNIGSQIDVMPTHWQPLPEPPE